MTTVAFIPKVLLRWLKPRKTEVDFRVIKEVCEEAYQQADFVNSENQTLRAHDSRLSINHNEVETTDAARVVPMDIRDRPRRLNGFNIQSLEFFKLITPNCEELIRLMKLTQTAEGLELTKKSLTLRESLQMAEIFFAISRAHLGRVKADKVTKRAMLKLNPLAVRHEFEKASSELQKVHDEIIYKPSV